MKTEDKTREQLLDELAALRQRVAELEISEAERKRLEHALGKRVKELKCLYWRSSDTCHWATCLTLAEESL